MLFLGEYLNMCSKLAIAQLINLSLRIHHFHNYVTDLFLAVSFSSVSELPFILIHDSEAPRLWKHA
jgi:hypothetical protein